MNFEFLRNLRQLGYIYDDCNNAEKLAITMPVQSIFTSRKSAEMLAKIIYMAACNQETKGLTFADILADYGVRDYVHDRKMMDAFHSIRKRGNLAVHTDRKETAGNAIDVLRNLHYVVGETACILGLIKNYPDFNPDVEACLDAKYNEDKEIDRKAKEMFLSYVKEFDAQIERDQYVKIRKSRILPEHLEGNVEMHEYLEFPHYPYQPEVLDYLQVYLSSLLRLSDERSPERAEKNGVEWPVTFDAKLIIGEKVYVSSEKDAFVKALAEELPEADGFVLDLNCDGNLREYYYDLPDTGIVSSGSLFIEKGVDVMMRKGDVWKGEGMYDALLSYKRKDSFTYKLAIYYPDRDWSVYEKIENGMDMDVLERCDQTILEKKFSKEWWSSSLNLYVSFDTKKNADKLVKLRDIVRNSIPESEIEFCESVWEEGEQQTLCNGIQWCPKDINEVQYFLNQINEVLLPIIDEVDGEGTGYWEIREEFAYATWKWTEQGFKIVGVSY